ncbi:MAG: ABC transporter permease, partial [bacterium]|nr:ABC transporter permease [bacterium]
ISLTAFGHIMQIAISMTTVWAIGTEFKFGTTKEWLKAADGSIITAFLGKITPYFVVMMILFGIIDQLYYGIFGAPYAGNIPIGFLCTILFTIACQSLGIIFMSVNGNFRLGLSFCAFYVAIGFALAGVTFPVMAMPKVVQAYTSIMPLNYWVQILLDQSLRNIPYIYDFKFLLPLLAIIFVGHVALIRLKQLAYDETRWDQS